MSDFSTWYDEGKGSTGGLPDSANKETNDFEAFVIDGENKQNDQLNQSMEAGRAGNPELQSRVLKQQIKTGLPEDLISRNLDQVEKQSTAADFDPVKFRKDSQ